MRVRVREDACWWHRGCRKLACQGPWGPVRHVRGPLVLAWPPPVKNRSRVSEIVEEKNRGRKQVQGARGREHTRHSLPLFPPSFLCGRRCWMCSVERSYKRVRGPKFRGWGSPSQVKKTRMFDSHFSVITPCVGYRRFVSQPLHTFLSLSLSLLQHISRISFLLILYNESTFPGNGGKFLYSHRLSLALVYPASISFLFNSALFSFLSSCSPIYKYIYINGGVSSKASWTSNSEALCA